MANHQPPKATSGPTHTSNKEITSITHATTALHDDAIINNNDNNNTNNSPTTTPPHPHTGITNRQFYIIATTSTIGAGLFLATYQALQCSGPGALVVAFAILGFAVWSTMCALGELSASFPTQGSFYDYAVRFVSPAVGFALGWNYVVSFMLAIPLEVTVMVLLMGFWGDGDGVLGLVGGAVLVPCFLVGLVVVSACGARWYAEFENVFAGVKVVVIVVFVVTACVILSSGGGGVSGDAMESSGREIGIALWRGTERNNYNDGAFRNGVSGVMFVFSLAAVAFGGTEMLGLVAGECKRPAKIMPVGSKIVAGRICLVYILPLVLLGLIVTIPPREEEDTAPGERQVLASPFILAISQAKIPVLPDVMNGIVLVAVFSMANACVLASSRALAALCRKGMGPRILSRKLTRAELVRGVKNVFTKTPTPTGDGADAIEASSTSETTRLEQQQNLGGQPLYAIGICFIFALLAFLAASPKATDIFDWLLALAGMSNYLTWSSICLSHIRMRRALKKQGRDIDEVVQWKAPLGIPGSVIALVIFGFGVVCQMYSAVMPPGDHGVAKDKAGIAKGFLGLVTCVGCWAGYQWCKGKGRFLIPLEEVDLATETSIIQPGGDVESRGQGSEGDNQVTTAEADDERQGHSAVGEKGVLGEEISQVETRNSSIGTVSALTTSRDTALTAVAYV